MKSVILLLIATLVLAVAGVFLFGLNDRVEALAASLAVDHVKCFKVSDPARHADAAGAEERWQHDQGWPIVVPQTAAAEQLTLVDVRRCFTTDGRSAHMMYKWRGTPLSLYVLPESIGRDRVVDKMGHEAVIWCANSRTYALVTDEGRADEVLRRQPREGEGQDRFGRRTGRGAGDDPHAEQAPGRQRGPRAVRSGESHAAEFRRRRTGTRAESERRACRPGRRAARSVPRQRRRRRPHQ